MVNHFFRILSLLIFIFCCLISNSNNSAIQAQPKTAAKSKSKTAKKPSKADKLFASARDYLVIQNNPTEAEKIFKKIIKKYPNYLQAYNELADLYTAQKKYADMRKIYTTMLERGKTPKNQFMVHLKWGEIEKKLGNYDTAALHLEKSLTQKVPANWDDRVKKAKNLLENSKFAAKAIKNPVTFKPIHLDSTINSRFDEYLPMITADEGTMVFTRRIGRDLRVNEDFYISRKDTANHWKYALPLGQPINTETNEGAISISPDGTRLFFAAEGRKDGLGGFDIYYSIRRGDGWEGPYNLGHPVNSPGWESQPCLSADGQELYFCSRRNGGLGVIDIWVSYLKDNFWTTPKNLGEPINTSGDEQTPFIHPDGQTFYFSSSGHVGMGDNDLFMTRKQPNGQWAKPQNLGYPINTYNNEGGLAVTASGQYAYYSALTDSAGFDIFYFELPKNLQPNFVTYGKGLITDAETKSELGANIDITDLQTGKIVIATSSDPLTGEFLFTLPLGKNYMCNVNKENYLFYSDHFSLDTPNPPDKPFLIDIKLKPIKRTIVGPNEKVISWNVGAPVVLKNVFFETGKYELQPLSYPELNRLVELLNQTPEMRIELSGHTDNVGLAAANQTLSVNRAKAVYNYLIAQGINANRLSYKGYGDTRPVAPNTTDEGRAANRRTEFTIL